MLTCAGRDSHSQMSHSWLPGSQNLVWIHVIKKDGQASPQEHAPQIAVSVQQLLVLRPVVLQAVNLKPRPADLSAGRTAWSLGQWASGLSHPCSWPSRLLQIVNLELSPAEFEQHVLGGQQGWRTSLLVEVDEESRQECIMAVPLGQWLQQQGIELDEQGCATGLSRFARDSHPSLSARCAALAHGWLIVQTHDYCTHVVWVPSHGMVSFSTAACACVCTDADACFAQHALELVL